MEGKILMTKKELSQYYWLKREIEDMEMRLLALREKADSPQAQRLTGMPRGGGPNDRMAEAVADIIDLEAIIAAKRIERIHQRQRIERFIYSIEDPMTRMVFMYRCIDGCSWREVAARMGHKMSEENARQTFHRYLRNAGGEEKTDGTE